MQPEEKPAQRISNHLKLKVITAAQKYRQASMAHPKKAILIGLPIYKTPIISACKIKNIHARREIEYKI